MSENNKLSKILSEIHALDWTPDSSYSLRNRPIRYVTAAKMKRQINPVLDKNGVYVVQTARGQPIVEANRIIQQYDFYLGGDGPISPAVTYYGEGSNEGKQCITAATNAYRAFCIGFFGIVDGMDDGESDIPAPRPKIIISDPFFSKQDVKNASDAPEPTSQSTAKPKISTLMQRAVDNALDRIEKADIPAEQKQEAEEKYNRIETAEDANKFLQFGKEVLG